MVRGAWLDGVSARRQSMIAFLRRTVAVCVLVTAVGWPRPGFAADQTNTVSAAPAGIVIDAEGNVYVSDYGLDRIVKFGPDGALLGQWGSSGTAAGQFNAPFGVALDERNTLFVVDQLN